MSDWESSVADTRIHGTTRQQVGKLFTTSEQPKLLPLPHRVFPVFSEAPRTVHRDGYVEVAPGLLLGAAGVCRPQGLGAVGVRLVRMFNTRMEQIAVHARQEPGKFTTDPAHIHAANAPPSNTGWTGCWIAPG